MADEDAVDDGADGVLFVGVEVGDGLEAELPVVGGVFVGVEDGDRLLSELNELRDRPRATATPRPTATTTPPPAQPTLSRADDDASNVNSNAAEDVDRRCRAAASTRPDTLDHTPNHTLHHALDVDAGDLVVESADVGLRDFQP